MTQGRTDIAKNGASKRSKLPLEQLPRLQATSSGPLALVLASCLLVLGCQPTPPGEEEREPLDPQADDVPLALETRTGDRARVERAQDTRSARAEIEPVPDSNVRGVVEFTETDTGVEVHATLSGLGAGPQGLHVHEIGDCSDPVGGSAGDHFDPNDNPHGSPDDLPDARHAGDLGNVHGDEDGRGELRLSVDGVTLHDERGIVGRAVVVHAGEDDLQTQPDGDAGDPIACGLIQSVETW